MNAIIPLVLKLHKEQPNLPITITSNTVTSASIIKKQLPKSVQHFYFPLDYSWAINRVIKKIKPKAIYIVETEFWPNFYTNAHKKNIPLIIINGRISEKTLYAKSWLLNIYSEILPLASKIYTRSETDQERFLKFGATPETTEILGNIKFSALNDINIEAFNSIKPYVLAASTREDEEKIIVDAWLNAEHKNHLLVIIPRHPNRLIDILNQLKPFNLNISVRSKKNEIKKSTDIYIADTIGELKQFILGSDFVLMGGSFVLKGGHNILEVAQLGKTVIFGSDMRNFEGEAKTFNEYNAGIQCKSNELGDLFSKLITDKEYRNQLEDNAKKLIGENNNINKYYKELFIK